MPVVIGDLLADLSAESRVVTDLVRNLDAPRWDLSTPAEGWSIRDQISHLAYFDEAATKAAVAPEEFRSDLEDLMQFGATFPDEIARRYRDLPSSELLEWFIAARADLLETFAELDPKTRLPWYGPDMSAASSVTARIMETWAHGQDIADALGVRREPSDRLRHVAHLGVGTFGFAHRLRDLDVPTDAVRVELAAPSGEKWSWGPEGAADRVSGAALDFCLVVTQRRHLADTTLGVVGPVANSWMSIAQAFAGAPGPGRAPLSGAGGG